MFQIAKKRNLGGSLHFSELKWIPVPKSSLTHGDLRAKGRFNISEQLNVFGVHRNELFTGLTAPWSSERVLVPGNPGPHNVLPQNEG